MEQHIHESVGQGVQVLAFTLVEDKMRVYGNRNFVEQFQEDRVAMSKMQELLKGNMVLKDTGW